MANRKMPMKARRRDADQERGLERAPADADDRLHDDDQNRRLDAEQRAVDRRHAARQHVQHAQAQHHDCARQDEQHAGRKPAERAVQEPADIGGKLLRLGTGQQHAVIQGVQESRLVDPFLLVHQDAMHGRDLAGRPAEAEQADLDPGPKRLAEGGQCLAFGRHSRRSGCIHGRHVAPHAALAGQSCRSSVIRDKS